MEDATLVLQETSLIAEQDLCRAGGRRENDNSIYKSVGDTLPINP